MHMFGGYGSMGYGGLGMIFMVLFWGLIIALVVILIRQASSRSNSNDEESPTDIVRQRYAKGEISKQEFDHLMAELK